MLLVAGSDFHGWRKNILGWNLIDKASINPGNQSYSELVLYSVIDKIFENRQVVLVTKSHPSMGDYRNIPNWLVPPVSAWHYLVQLQLTERLCWLLVLAAWITFVSRKRVSIS